MLFPWTRPLPHMSRSVHSSFTVASHPTCNHMGYCMPYVRATFGLLPTLYSGQRAADLLVDARLSCTEQQQCSVVYCTVRQVEQARR